jgi:hypothetical protein
VRFDVCFKTRRRIAPPAAAGAPALTGAGEVGCRRWRQGHPRRDPMERAEENRRNALAFYELAFNECRLALS